jgi:hypothetical protein
VVRTSSRSSSFVSPIWFSTAAFILDLLVCAGL